MTQANVTAYPWNALESVSRMGARRAARARRQVQATLDLPRLASALGTLLASEASLVVRRVGTDAPRRRPLTELGFEFGGGTVCALAIEPELALGALSRMLRRPLALTSHGTLDDSLSGALTAVVLELARRAGAQGTLSVLDPNDARARATDVFVEATLLLGGIPYQVLVALSLLDAAPHLPEALAALGELPIALPLVVGCGLAARAELANLVPGNAWFPGAGLWLDARLEGQIVLAAASHDRGLAGTLSRDGKIVLRGESVELLFDESELMSDPGKPEASLSDAVLDSPVVVRVEVGAVSLTAREWAELGPGDVIETGRRIAEPVILRIAGREVARGELVNLEGEIGVRIRELVRS
ncbi:MAG: FliM/FliN family flagellar motor switch protein [Pseudomonadota bacterium]